MSGGGQIAVLPDMGLQARPLRGGGGGGGSRSSPWRGAGRLSPRAVKTTAPATQSGSACLPDRDETSRAMAPPPLPLPLPPPLLLLVLVVLRAGE